MHHVSLEQWLGTSRARRGSLRTLLPFALSSSGPQWDLVLPMQGDLGAFVKAHSIQQSINHRIWEDTEEPLRLVIF